MRNPIFLPALVVLGLGLVATTAEAEVSCGDGSYCPDAAPVCCTTVCCGTDFVCAADGNSCIESGIPSLPECEPGMRLALNVCGPEIDDCGCTSACTAPSDCATGCCLNGWCALTCMCEPGSSPYVSYDPTPVGCSEAQLDDDTNAGTEPIGGFGGGGCNAAVTDGAIGWVLLAIGGLLARRRRQ